MNEYDVIAIAEASRCSSSSHSIQVDYFITSGIKYFTCEGLGPIECHLLNKYKDPELLGLFTLSGNGTRTLLNKTKNVIFVPTDYYMMYIKNPRILDLLPKEISQNLEMDADGRVINYNETNVNQEYSELHEQIKHALANKKPRDKFWLDNIVKFISTNKLFILGYKLELGKFGIGSVIRKIKGNKFLSIGIGVIANFQLSIVKIVYPNVPQLSDHSANMFDPDVNFMIDDAYKYVNLTRFEKTVLADINNRKSIFIWTKSLPPKATFHQFPWGLSPPIVGTLVRPKKKGDQVKINIKKYNGYETPVHIYDALLMLNESIFNADITI